MAAPLTQDDLDRYGDVLSEIKARIEHAWGLLENVAERFDLESAALQLRKSIELIALATLAVNRQSATAVSSKLHQADWNDARHILGRLNPEYWPVPFEWRSGADSPPSLEPLQEPFLEESVAGAEWGFLSNLLHADNPLSPRTVDQSTVDRTRSIAIRIQNLLALHTADLGGRQHLVLATMDEPGTGDVVARVLNGVIATE
jgi:hypothetical protein